MVAVAKVLNVCVFYKLISLCR